MMYDETFYDRYKNKYIIDSFIDDGIEKFGGYDAVVLWHAPGLVPVPEFHRHLNLRLAALSRNFEARPGPDNPRTPRPPHKSWTRISHRLSWPVLPVVSSLEGSGAEVRSGPARRGIGEE